MAPPESNSAGSKRAFTSKSSPSMPTSAKIQGPLTPAESDRGRSGTAASGNTRKRSASAAQIDDSEDAAEDSTLTITRVTSQRTSRASHGSRKRARTEDVPVPSIEVTNAASGRRNPRPRRPKKQLNVKIYDFEDVQINKPIHEYMSSRRESFATAAALETEHSLRGWRTTGFIDLLAFLTGPKHTKKAPGSHPFLRRFTRIPKEKPSTGTTPAASKGKPRWEWTDDAGRHGDTGKIDSSNILEHGTRRPSTRRAQKTPRVSLPRIGRNKPKKSTPSQTHRLVDEDQAVPSSDLAQADAITIPKILTTFPEILEGEDRNVDGLAQDGDENGVFIDSGSVTTIHYEGKEYIDFQRTRLDTGEEERFWILAQRRPE